MKNKLAVQIGVVIFLFFIGFLLKGDIGTIFSLATVWCGFIILASFPFNLSYKISTLIVLVTSYYYIHWRITVAYWDFPFPPRAVNAISDIGGALVLIFVFLPIITLTHFFFRKKDLRHISEWVAFWVVTLTYTFFCGLLGFFFAYASYDLGKSLVQGDPLELLLVSGFLLLCAYYYFIKQSYIIWKTKFWR